MNIDVTPDKIDFFQCFSSKNKLLILQLLSQQARNIGDLAKILGVSSTIVTRHIHDMESAGIVKSTLESGKRGQQKICSLAVDEAVLNFGSPKINTQQSTVMTLPVGQFSNFHIEPTCGLASTEKYIGMVDDPRYFSDPEASKAGIVWFESGYIEYTLPSYLFDYSDKIKSLTIALELCSEYPHFKNDHLSDIHFSLNSKALGYWTSPGSFGGKKGIHTPQWFTCGTEYGLLKRLMINREGTFIDGKQISSITLESLNLNNNKDQVLRIASPENAEHPGGVTIFGKGFGNHNQDIQVTVIY